MVRGISDDFWATFVDPSPADPTKRVMTVWGQGTINVNTANPLTLYAVVCSGAPQADICTDPAQMQLFVTGVLMAQSITMGAPLFGSPAEFISTMKGQGTLGPLLTTLGMKPVKFQSESDFAKSISTESKVFSVYAIGAVKGYRERLGCAFTRSSTFARRRRSPTSRVGLRRRPHRPPPVNPARAGAKIRTPSPWRCRSALAASCCTSASSDEIGGSGFMPTWLGIDIGSVAVKAAVVRSAYRKIAVVRLASADVATSGGTLEAVREAVTKALEGEAHAADSIATAIDGNRAAIHRLVVPATAQRQLEEVLTYELEAQIPFDIEGAVFDWRLIGRDVAPQAAAGGAAAPDAQLSIVAAVARIEDVRARIDLVKSAVGQEPERVGVGCAHARRARALHRGARPRRDGRNRQSRVEGQ